MTLARSTGLPGEHWTRRRITNVGRDDANTSSMGGAMQSPAKFITLLVICPLVTPGQHAPPRNGSNDRTNANLQEAQLTPATVSASAFGKLGVFPVDGPGVCTAALCQRAIDSGQGNAQRSCSRSTMHNGVYALRRAGPCRRLPCCGTSAWAASSGVTAAVRSGTATFSNGGRRSRGTGVIDLERAIPYVVSSWTSLRPAGPSLSSRASIWPGGAEAAEWSGCADPLR